jgi:hypothetical protein
MSQSANVSCKTRSALYIISALVSITDDELGLEIKLYCILCCTAHKNKYFSLLVFIRQRVRFFFVTPPFLGYQTTKNIVS